MDDLGIVCAAVFEIFLRALTSILSSADYTAHMLNRKSLHVDLQVFVEFLKDSDLIICIADRKLRSISQQFRMPAQHPSAKRMKSADQGSFLATMKSLLNSAFHLTGGLVGESHSENPIRLTDSFTDQICDLVGDGAGLSASSAGQNQHRTFGMGDREELLLVQLI